MTTDPNPAQRAYDASMRECAHRVYRVLRARSIALEARYPHRVEWSDLSGRAARALRDARLWSRWQELGGHVRLAYDRLAWDAGDKEGSDWCPDRETRAYSDAIGIDAGDPDEGLVRLLIVADTDYDVGDFEGPESAVKRERARAEDLGVWGVVAQYRLDAASPWERCGRLGGECWGFIGDDWADGAEDYARDAIKALDIAAEAEDERLEAHAARDDAARLVRTVARMSPEIVGADPEDDAQTLARIIAESRDIVARLDGTTTPGDSSTGAGR